MSGPGDHLITHHAPVGLLAASRQPRRPVQVWGLALAAAAGLMIGVGVSSYLQHDEQTVEPGARSVTLVYHAPEAGSVAVAGTFNGWDPASVAMHRVGEGAFRTVLWLPPGQYEYQFVVDGETWTPDPLSSRQRDDGFGSTNSVLDL